MSTSDGLWISLSLALVEQWDKVASQLGISESAIALIVPELSEHLRTDWLCVVVSYSLANQLDSSDDILFRVMSWRWVYDQRGSLLIPMNVDPERNSNVVKLLELQAQDFSRVRLRILIEWPKIESLWWFSLLWYFKEVKQCLPWLEMCRRHQEYWGTCWSRPVFPAPEHSQLPSYSSWAEQELPTDLP